MIRFEEQFTAADGSRADLWIDTATNQLCICTGDEVLQLSRDGEVARFIETLLSHNTLPDLFKAVGDEKRAKELAQMNLELHRQTKAMMKGQNDDG